MPRKLAGFVVVPRAFCYRAFRFRAATSVASFAFDFAVETAATAVAMVSEGDDGFTRDLRVAFFGGASDSVASDTGTIGSGFRRDGFFGAG